MTEDLKEILNLAKELARKSGEYILDHSRSNRRLELSLKSRRDIVTELDYWVESTIFQHVHARYPDHVLIGEESAAKLVQNEERDLRGLISTSISWIIDPIDGTVNFANRIPHYAVSIAVVFRGVREVGVVYDPSLDEMFTAVRGGGAFLNGVPIQSSNKNELLDCVVGTGSPADWTGDIERYSSAVQSLARSARCLRRFGAASLDFCWVACGRLDACFEPCLKPWDVAAGSLIAEEAGAKICHFLPEGDDFFLTANSFLCGPEGLTQAILRIIS